jgi:hypothetical protein
MTTYNCFIEAYNGGQRLFAHGMRTTSCDHANKFISSLRSYAYWYKLQDLLRDPESATNFYCMVLDGSRLYCSNSYSEFDWELHCVTPDDVDYTDVKHSSYELHFQSDLDTVCWFDGDTKCETPLDEYLQDPKFGYVPNKTDRYLSVLVGRQKAAGKKSVAFAQPSQQLN